MVGSLKFKPVDLCDILAKLKDHYSHIPDREVDIRLTAAPQCFIYANELVRDVFTNPEKKLFARFKRGKTKASGRGLGLYLKTLLEYTSANISVENRIQWDYPKGVSFVVLLPAILHTNIPNICPN